MIRLPVIRDASKVFFGSGDDLGERLLFIELGLIDNVNASRVLTPVGPGSVKQHGGSVLVEQDRLHECFKLFTATYYRPISGRH
jgi:hypothetical protein